MLVGVVILGIEVAFIFHALTSEQVRDFFALLLSPLIAVIAAVFEFFFRRRKG
ncbi:hypothetical protein PV458_05530 [Streptomyces sp. MN03-5084-2B]|nr:hypothetical protein [Streptomyces sp. MN03-5084-2B]